MQISLKIIDSRIQLPAYSTPGSAGMDLRAALQEPLTLQPNEVCMVPTGIAIYLEDPNFAAIIMPRSGKGHEGIILGNTVGLIDSDYQGQLKMSLWNRSEKAITITPLERIAQLVIVPVVQATFKVVGDFDATQRGEGGFNSTGSTT